MYDSKDEKQLKPLGTAFSWYLVQYYELDN